MNESSWVSQGQTLWYIEPHILLLIAPHLLNVVGKRDATNLQGKPGNARLITRTLKAWKPKPRYWSLWCVLAPRTLRAVCSLDERLDDGILKPKLSSSQWPPLASRLLPCVQHLKRSQNQAFLCSLWQSHPCVHIHPLSRYANVALCQSPNDLSSFVPKK